MIGQGQVIIAVIAYFAGVATYPAGRVAIRKVAEKIVAYATKAAGK